jgi:hypothetical protein
VGIAALEKARAGLTCKTAVHICYGYGIEANIKWKETLGDEWRQYEQTFPLLAKSSIDQVSLECANSHVPMELIGLLKGKDVLVGCIDVASTKVETPEDVARVIREALKYVPKERLSPAPTAAWSRSPGTWRAASFSPWARARHSCARKWSKGMSTNALLIFARLPRSSSSSTSSPCGSSSRRARSSTRRSTTAR